MPWVKDARRRYGSRGFTVVGIHTPEMESDRARVSVGAEVQRRQLDFPHLIDSDHVSWNALDNHYWPALYPVDRCGRIRANTIGEVHSDQESGQRLEAEIEALLEEAPADCARD